MFNFIHIPRNGPTEPIVPTILSYNPTTLPLSAVGDVEEIIKLDDNSMLKAISAEAIKTEKIKKAYEVIKQFPDLTTKEFKVKVYDLLLTGINSKIYENKTNRTLYDWGKFINNNL